MNKKLPLKASLLACFFLIPTEEIIADTNFYQQVAATEAKKKPLKKQKVDKKTSSKALPKIPSKPSLFLKAGIINTLLQYSMVETTGTQLSVDGFSLLPVFVAGNIESQDIVRTGHRFDISISRTLTLDSQVILNIPYRIESEQLTNDEGQTTTQTRKNSKGLGDISLTYRQQIFKNNHKLPSLTGAITWKPPTGKDAYEDTDKLGLGTGFHSIRTGISTIKQDDPVLLFANMGYTWNIKGKKRNFGTIDTGDIYDLSFGAAYYLTNNFSMNFSLEQTWAMKTTVKGRDVINSDKHTASLAIGGRLNVSPKKPITVRAKIGLNESTPDFQIQLAIPFN